MFIESRWSGGRCNLVPSVAAWAVAVRSGPCLGLCRGPSLAGRQEGPRHQGAGSRGALSRWPQSGLPAGLLHGAHRHRCWKAAPDAKEKSRERRRFLSPAGCRGGRAAPLFLPGSHGHSTGPVKCLINSMFKYLFECVYLRVCVYHTLPCNFYLSCKFEYFTENGEKERKNKNWDQGNTNQPRMPRPKGKK